MVVGGFLTGYFSGTLEAHKGSLHSISKFGVIFLDNDRT